MRIITELRLKNFQIWEDRKIKFGPTTNVLIGDNNGGKSSFIRAFYWIMNNKPTGDWMRRFDPDGNDGERLTTIAEMIIDNCVSVKRIKGDGINEYWLDDEKFTSVGRGDPPLPIVELFGTIQLPFGKDLIPCIAMQDEQPFMVFEASRIKGNLLNYLTGVDVGDRMRKDINSEARQLTRSIGSNLSDIERDEIELDKYKAVSKMEDRLGRAEKIDKKLKGLHLSITKLSNVQFGIERTDTTIELRIKQIKLLNRSITLMEQLQTTANIAGLLNSLKRTGISPKLLKGYSVLLNSTESLSDECATINNDLVALVNLQDDLEEVEDTLHDIHKTIKVTKKELSKHKLCSKCKGSGVLTV